jgi:hypothetical protein
MLVTPLWCLLPIHGGLCLLVGGKLHSLQSCEPAVRVLDQYSTHTTTSQLWRGISRRPAPTRHTPRLSALSGTRRRSCPVEHAITLNAGKFRARLTPVGGVFLGSPRLMHRPYRLSGARPPGHRVAPSRLRKSYGGARPRSPRLVDASANVMGRGLHEPRASSQQDRPWENVPRTSWSTGDSTLCRRRSVSLCLPSQPLCTLASPLSHQLKPTPWPARALPYASAPRLMSLSSQRPWSFWLMATVALLSSARPWSADAMPRRLAALTVWMAIRPIGWRANMLSRSDAAKHWGAVAWRSSS